MLEHLGSYDTKSNGLQLPHKLWGGSRNAIYFCFTLANDNNCNVTYWTTSGDSPVATLTSICGPAGKRDLDNDLEFYSNCDEFSIPTLKELSKRT